MAKVMKLRNGTDSVAGILAAGAVVSMVMTLIGTAVCAALIASETIAAGGMGYCAVGVLLLSAFAGAAVAARGGEQKHFYLRMAAGGIYFLMLLAVTALFFEGQYQGVGVTAFVVFSGCILSALLRHNRRNGTKMRKSKIRRR